MPTTIFTPKKCYKPEWCHSKLVMYMKSKIILSSAYNEGVKIKASYILI